MTSRPKFHADIIRFENPQRIIDDIVIKLRKYVVDDLRRQGGVIGISGGIDSSLTLALSAKALGADKVLGIMLPEKDSSADSKRLALLLAETFGVRTVEENITPALEGFGCYKRRDEAVKRIFSDYNPEEHNMKIGINSSINSNLPPLFSITIVDKQGTSKNKLLPVKEYLQIVASSNFKQRSRMAMIYHHAELRHYAVIGTPNKHEVEQGFFVKYGDSAVDVMPIAHLYKSQVYQLAGHLGIPGEIIDREPTSDTYSADQSQQEFFYQMPFQEMDLIWYGFENGFPPGEVGDVMGKTEDEINTIYKNFVRKQKTTDYLRMPPIKDF
jgi:NAD+ synthase